MRISRASRPVVASSTRPPAVAIHPVGLDPVGLDPAVLDPRLLGFHASWSPRRRTRAAMATLTALLAAAFLAAIAFGSVSIPLSQVIRALLGRSVRESSWTTIVWSVRLPRACTAVCAGAALASAGLVLQTFFRNPLADPTVLGVSAGAGLGVALAVLGSSAAGFQLLGHDGPFARLGIVAASFVGAAAVLAVILVVARRVGHRSTVLIVGLMVGFALSSIVSVLVSVSTNEQLRSFVVWGQGSFRGTSWPDVAVLAGAVCLGAAVLVVLAKPLDAVLLGDRTATSLGVDLRRLRLAVIGVTAVLTATVTAFCGPIAFLGIAVPHLTRGLLRQARHRVLLPATALCGAAMALICEIVAQLPGSDRVLPLNAITALLGAPVVVWVLLRRRGSEQAA